MSSRPNTLGIALGVGLIRVYQLTISPLFPGACRFVPSCSAYASEAVREHGVGRGVWLAAKRLARCHPLCAGGHDPVPPAEARRAKPAMSDEPGCGAELVQGAQGARARSGAGRGAPASDEPGCGAELVQGAQGARARSGAGRGAPASDEPGCGAEPHVNRSPT